MEQRRAERYVIAESIAGKNRIGDAYCEFDFNETLRGRLVDMSLSGMGIVVDNLNGSALQEIKQQESFMITIRVGADAFAAGVKSVWKQVLYESGNMILRCGVSIEIISDKDRLKLSEIIMKIRSAS